MIRDLMKIGVNLVRGRRWSGSSTRAERNAEERLLDLLLPKPGRATPRAGPWRCPSLGRRPGGAAGGGVPGPVVHREKLRKLSGTALEDRTVQVDVTRPRPGGDHGHAAWRTWGSSSRTCWARCSRRARSPGTCACARPRDPFAGGERAPCGHGQVTEAARRGRIRPASSSSTRSTNLRRPPGFGPGRVRGGAAGPSAGGRGLHGEHQVRHGPLGHILIIAAGAFHFSQPSDWCPNCRAGFPCG